jgi:acyl-CoA synthetase
MRPELSYRLPRPFTGARVPQWSNLDEAIKHWARVKPAAAAFVEPAGRMSWRAYDEYISLLAGKLADAGVMQGEHVGIWLPDGAAVHVAFSACLRAGIVFVAIGARSGPRELRHLLGKASATTLITTPHVGTTDTRALFTELATELPMLARYIDVTDSVAAPTGIVATAGDPDGVVRAEQRIIGRRMPTDQLAFLNSTSGTTGLPKCVAHDEQRWLKYHEYSVDAGELTTAETCMSVVPALFGFGLWTAHFTPTLLGAPTVVVPRFDVGVVLDLLEAERVTVLMAVSTQFIMLLGEPDLERRDLSALRVLFTGRGRAVLQGGGVREAHGRNGVEHVRLERDRRAELHDDGRQSRAPVRNRRPDHPRAGSSPVRR